MYQLLCWLYSPETIGSLISIFHLIYLLTIISWCCSWDLSTQESHISSSNWNPPFPLCWVGAHALKFNVQLIMHFLHTKFTWMQGWDSRKSKITWLEICLCLLVSLAKLCFSSWASISMPPQASGLLGFSQWYSLHTMKINCIVCAIFFKFFIVIPSLWCLGSFQSVECIFSFVSLNSLYIIFNLHSSHKFFFIF